MRALASGKKRTAILAPDTIGSQELNPRDAWLLWGPFARSKESKHTLVGSGLTSSSAQQGSTPSERLILA
eukprot:6570446-Alexandrium_andersonii.AAC.1